MKTLYIMLLKFFIPVFLVTLLFFILIFEFMDIFQNIWLYLNNQITLAQIGRIALYYLPKCLSYSLPIGFLFSITFTLGNLYTNNELIAIFGSGISLYKFTFPFIVISLAICLFYFLFDDKVVIDTYIMKNEYQNTALKKVESYSNSNVAVKTADNRIIYQAITYNSRNNTLTDVNIIERDEQGNLLQIIKARDGEWNGTNWVLRGCRIFKWNEDHSFLEEKDQDLYMDPGLNTEPRIFQTKTHRIDEMEQEAALKWIEDLKRAGQNYNKELSEYYKKFAFAFTPLIVALISCSVGGLLRKNVLLMSLLFSICIVVVYYVIQMVTMALSSNGYIHPILGAWSSFILFSIIGVVLFRIART